MLAGSVWDEVLDTEHAVVVRTYIERWPRRDRSPEKVLIVGSSRMNRRGIGVRRAGGAAGRSSAA